MSKGGRVHIKGESMEAEKGGIPLPSHQTGQADFTHLMWLTR